MDIYYRAKKRNPKTVTKHIVMLNFIDRTNLEKIHLHLCKKKIKHPGNRGELEQKKCSSNI
jgi:hypothetical protein